MGWYLSHQGLESITLFSFGGDNWTPPTFIGPKNRSHSSAIVSQCHSKRCTIPQWPGAKFGLVWESVRGKRDASEDANGMCSFMLAGF